MRTPCPSGSLPSTNTRYVVHGRKSTEWRRMSVRFALYQLGARALEGSVGEIVFEAFIGRLKLIVIHAHNATPVAPSAGSVCVTYGRFAVGAGGSIAASEGGRTATTAEAIGIRRTRSAATARSAQDDCEGERIPSSKPRGGRVPERKNVSTGRAPETRAMEKGSDPSNPAGTQPRGPYSFSALSSIFRIEPIAFRSPENA